MKVFISWSGELSRAVARILRDWLPDVLQEVEPWLAETDVQSGSRWTSDLGEMLSASSAVILCVTRDNLRSGWFNFEAGAASRTVGAASLIPILLDLYPVDLTGPIAQFQSVMLDDDGIRRLVLNLNSRLSHPLDNQQLARIIDRWMPELLAPLEEIRLAVPSSELAARADRDIIQEILENIHSLSSQVNQLQIASSQEPTTPSAEIDTQGPSEAARVRVFIGSSTHGLPIAQAIQAGLDDFAECTVWDQGLFKPSDTNIESLVGLSAAFDFAIIVMTADDVLTKKGNTTLAPRDNLVFELGLFTGSLGRAKTFLVKSRDEAIELPSDLDGVTKVEYGRRSDGNLMAAVGPVCFRVKQVIGLG